MGWGRYIFWATSDSNSTSRIKRSEIDRLRDEICAASFAPARPRCSSRLQAENDELRLYLAGLSVLISKRIVTKVR